MQSICKFFCKCTHSLTYVTLRFYVHKRCIPLPPSTGNVTDTVYTSIFNYRGRGKTNMSYISWKVGTRDKQGFIFSGRVQVYVLTLCDMQLLCTVYVQPYSAEMIILPKPQQHCEGYNSRSKAEK